MTHIISPVLSRSVLRRFCQLMPLLTLLVLLAGNALAQQTKSATDGSTPLALKPGQPAGSFALSGFDNVNPYNGNLNFHLPLLQIGGRGSAQMTQMLKIDSKGWRVKQQDVAIQDPDCPHCISYAITRIPEPNPWMTREPGYGAGLLVGRHSGTGSSTLCGDNVYVFTTTLTRLTFITADGTEYELRDRLYDGQPQTSYTCPAVSRGKVFTTADGTAATFISDEPISDLRYSILKYPSGQLMLKDGTRYRIDGGNVSWMRDRNGNLMTFTYSSNRVRQITDSLNRQVTIDYDVTDVAPYGLCDRITYRGFNGAQRVIRISKTNLSNVLRPGFTLKNYSQLFPELNGSSSGTPWNPIRFSAVWLPNDRSYQFYYNSYGELARVELPTGGATEYDYTPGSGCIDELGSNCTDPRAELRQVFRRVTTRRVYKERGTLHSGGTLDSKMTFSDPNEGCAYYPCGGDTTVTVDHYNATGGRLLKEKHYYYGKSADTLWQVATAYPPWKHGREFKSETHDSTSTEANPKPLRVVEQAWAQRTPLPAWIAAKASDTQPSHDVRLTQTVTTLADTGTDTATGTANPHQVTKQTFTYDQYNNQTNVYEYDYGDGVVGPFLRRTHTDYLTINEINNADYASLMVNTTDPSGGSTIQPAEACQTCGEGGDDPGPTPTPTPGPTPLPTPNPTNPDLDATIHIRNLPTQQWVSADAAGNQKKTIITYEYDNYTPDAGNKHAALQARLNISGLDTTFTSSKQTRGNVTALTRRLIQESRDLTTYQQYDVAGNVVKVIDALGSATAFDFTDRFGVPSDNEARTNTVPAELVSANSYALATKVTLPSVGGSAQVTYTQYDYYTGKAVNAEDPNGTVYSGYYNDELDRPSMLVTAGADTALRTQTKFIYNDIDRTITTTSDRTTYDDDLLKSQVVYDGLGRTVETRSYEDATNYILVEQTYDGLGRVKSQSNPYRPVGTTPETAAWTTNTYDELGRITQVQTPDNAKINTTYKGNATTVRDQALKKRESRVDALGRLVEVIEDPDGVAYQTSYQYDVLDNLTKVVQGGQTRTFTYDSLKRLVQAVNPESGTIKYEYDDNGNLVKKIDPRKVTTTPLVYLEMTFAYDALNRVTSKTYNDNGETPSVIYKYDAQALPTGAPGAAVFDRGASTGRLVAVTYGGTAWGTYYGYDGLGRVSEKVQRTDGINYEVNATYNRAGAMLTETYPVNPETGARRVVTRTFDGAGRLRSLSTAGASVTNIQYAAHGALESETYGTLLHQINYNTRLQPTAIELGTNADDPTSKLNLSYTYGTTYNSGNIASAKITVGTTEVWNQTFTYDALNRLDIAKEVKDGTQQWMQKNEYDRYGNRWQVVDGNPSLTFNTANNRITTAGYSYDLAGNLTSMPRGDQTLNVTYDAENHIKSVGADAAYVYDGEGQRVRKLLGENLLMVYGIGGELLAEFDGAAVNKPLKKEYIYGADGLLATIAAGEGTRYITADHLGSPRIITTASGGVVNRHDYEPFGEELFVGMGGRTALQDYSSETDGLRQKFTGYERDIETGLDYAQARYYGSIMGRFTSPDPLLSSGEPENPQTWNRYSYALNNPLLYTDPFGLYVYGNNVTDEQKKQFEEALDQAKSYLKKIKETYGPNSNEYKKAERALNAYGKPGEDNGVTVIASSKVGAGETTLNNNKTITVAFNPKQFGSDFFQALVGHEGSHVADTKNYLATGNSPTKYQYEYDGYFVQSVLGEAQAKEMNYVNYYASTGGTKTAPEKKVDLWNKSWAEADKATLRSKAINEFLAISKKDGGYGLSPRDKGKALFITQPRRRRR